MISRNYPVGKLKHSKLTSETIWFEWSNYSGSRYFIAFRVHAISVWSEQLHRLKFAIARTTWKETTW